VFETNNLLVPGGDVAVARTKERRHQDLLAILMETGTASVAELGARLGVTEMTIRRDLETLEANGALKRFHGGAKLAFGSSYEPPFPVRERTNSAEKQAIGERVAGLIRDGDTVILDGGSTGIAVAKYLAERQVMICPLSLRVAWVFERSTSVNLLLPSGTARPGELSISGADTNDFLRAHHFDHYVMTASGASLGNGFTEWNVEDAAVKRTALQVADNTIAAIDSSKYGNVGFVRICAIDRPQAIVIDNGLLPGQLDELRRAATDIVLAN
jgi:DeoR/GlpR family transcriptional regulator of sugar metabolism